MQEYSKNGEKQVIINKRYEDFVRLFLDTHYSEDMSDEDIQAMLYMAEEKKKKVIGAFEIIDKAHEYAPGIQNKFSAARPKVILTSVRLFSRYYAEIQNLYASNIAILSNYYAFYERDWPKKTINLFGNNKLLKEIDGLFYRNFVAQSEALDFIYSYVESKGHPGVAMEAIRQNSDYFRFTPRKAVKLGIHFHETYVETAREGKKDK